MAADDDQTQLSGKEIDATIAGQHIRAKGYRLIDLIWLPMILGIGYTCLTLYNHEATARDEKNTTTQSVKEANTAIVQALRESNSNMVKAIEVMTIEQRRSTTAMKEVACLQDPAMKNRPDARDFCKRITRDDR